MSPISLEFLNTFHTKLYLKYYNLNFHIQSTKFYRLLMCVISCKILISCGLINVMPTEIPAMPSVAYPSGPSLPTSQFPPAPKIPNSIVDIGQLQATADRLSSENLRTAPEIAREHEIIISANQSLNTDAGNRSFSVVLRIYQLQQSSAFENAFYDVFLDTQKTNATFGSDLISSKEITLVPGKSYIHTENLDSRTEYIGVAVLFRSPAVDRWKLTFPIKFANNNGITLGIHGCSITVSSGTSIEYGTQTQNTLKSPGKCG